MGYYYINMATQSNNGYKIMKEYENISDIPNRRGEYCVMVDFKHDSELVKVVIGYDIDEVNDKPITNAYSYYVESLDGIVYDSCYGFATIAAMIPNIAPRLKEIE